MIDPITKLQVPDPVPTAPMAPFQVVAPPEESNRVENVGPSNTTVLPSAAAVQAEGDLKTAREAEDKAAAAKAEADQAARVQAAAAAQEQADKAAEQTRAREALRAQHDAEVKQLQAIAEQKRQEMEAAAHPMSYWENRGAPSSVVAKFLTVLNGVTGGMAGTGNQTFEAYQKAQDQDRQDKIRKFTDSKEFHHLAQQNVGASHAALVEKLKQFDDEAIVQGNVLQKQIDAIAKRTNLPGAQAEADGFKAQRQVKRAEDDRKEQQHYSTQVQSGHTTTSQTVNTNKTPAGAGPPDLTALTGDGKPFGKWRTIQEAQKGRDAQEALVTLKGATEELNAHIAKYGKLVDPTSKEYADRQTLGANVSRPLQVMNDAGVLNPGEFERNIKSVNTTLFKGGDAAVSANKLLVGSADRSYQAKLGAKAIREDAAAAGAPAKTEVAPAKSDRKSLMGDADKLRAWLKTPAAKENPDKAKAVKTRLREMAEAYGSN